MHLNDALAKSDGIELCLVFMNKLVQLQPRPMLEFRKKWGLC